MVELNLPRTWGSKLVVAIRAINDELEDVAEGGGGGVVQGLIGSVNAIVDLDGGSPVISAAYNTPSLTLTDPDDGWALPTDCFSGYGDGEFADMWVPRFSGLYNIRVILTYGTPPPADHYIAIAGQHLAAQDWDTQQTFYAPQMVDGRVYIRAVPLAEGGLVQMQLRKLGSTDPVDIIQVSLNMFCCALMPVTY